MIHGHRIPLPVKEKLVQNSKIESYHKLLDVVEERTILTDGKSKAVFKTSPKKH